MTLEVLDRITDHAYLSPKVEVRAHPATGGHGLYARAPIAQGELISVWAGVIVNGDKLRSLPEAYMHRAVQVEEDLYQVSLRLDEPADHGNHSCDPNAGLLGQIVLVAMRAIVTDEEVCFDYATSDGSPYSEFECQCGSPNCRGQVTGEDWRRPDLWDRYAGHFSPYLQRRIDRLRAEMRAERASDLEAEHLAARR